MIECYDDIRELVNTGKVVVIAFHEDHYHFWTWHQHDLDPVYRLHAQSDVRVSYLLPFFASVYKAIERECIYT